MQIRIQHCTDFDSGSCELLRVSWQAARLTCEVNGGSEMTWHCSRARNDLTLQQVTPAIGHANP
ncbi:hypothetical protein HaLaN_30340 [Haematococcus lacustris]|uniref:Uncharacterized protein n=1 Tax=Haematococcus lacustris TaxID=44745 RepID=A0A6A0AFA9_HAELA|nr:hypothetical protein HaLaN_30340 [Haematococcus lacustris]